MRLHVLILEDSPSDAELITHHLTKEGIDLEWNRVETRDDFVSALAEPPDVIIADYVLPSFTGLHAISLLKERGLDIPVILVSGAVGEEIAVQAMKEGARDYLLKGNLTRLGPAVRNAVEDKRRRDEMRAMEQALEAARARLAGILDTAADAIINIDEDQRILLFNKGAERLYAYQAEEVLGQPLGRLIPDRFEQIHREHVEHFLKSRESARRVSDHIKIVGRRKDGSEFPAEASISKLQQGGATTLTVILRDITERKQTELQLADALEFTNRILTSSPIGILTYRLTGECITANAYAAQMVGATIEQLKGQNFHELESWKKSGLYELAEKAISTGELFAADIHIITTFGKEAWFRAQFVKFKSAGEELLLLTIADITESKQTEERLAASEAKLRAVFAAMHDVVLIIDRDGVYREIAPTNPGLLARPPKELLGKTLKDVFSKERADEFLAVVRNVVESQEPSEIEYQLQIGDRKLWFAANLTPMGSDATVWVAHEITERKEAELALKQAEAKYHSIFENAVMGIYQTTLEGQYISANRALARMFGYETPEAMIAGVTDLNREFYVEPNRRATFKRHLEESDIVTAFESEVMRKDGATMWISENARVVRDENGIPLYYEGTTEDITPRKRAEAALRDSEERYRLLFESNPLPMWVYDTNALAFLAVNDAAVEHYGYARDEFLNMTIEDIRLPEELPLLRETLGQTGTAPRRSGVWKHLKKDGTLIDVEIFSYGVSFLEKSARLVLANDVTERRRAELALHQAEAKYRSIFENAVMGIYQTTPQGQFISANRSLARMFGYDNAEDLIANITDLNRGFYVKPTRREDFMRQLEEHGTIAGFESEIYRRDGSRMWISENARATRDKNGKLLCYEGTFEDITARKRAEQRLMESEQRFRLLFTTSPDAILLLDMEDPNTKEPIVDCNEAACQMNGYRHEELLGRSIEFLDANPRLAELEPKIAEQINQKGVAHFETYHRHKDGHIFPLEVSLSKLSIGGHNLLLSIERDVSERRNAENRLRESQANLAAAQRITHLGSWELAISDFNELASNSLQWSDEVFRIFGYQPGQIEVTVAGFFSAIHPDDNLKVETALVQALNSNSALSIDHRILRPDGTERIVHEQGEMVLGEAGRPLKMVGTVQDVTASRLAEQALRESEKRFQSLFENTPIAIWEEDFSRVKDYLDTIKDLDASNLEEYLMHHPEVVLTCRDLVRVTDVNQAALKMHEAHEKTELIRGLSETFTLETTDSFRRELLAIARREYQMDMDVQLRTLTGKIKQAALNWAVAPGHEGTYGRVLVSLMDLTERAQREHELEAIASVSAALRSAKTLDGLLGQILDQALAVVEANAGSIWLYDPLRDVIELKLHKGWDAGLPITSVKPGVDLPGLVVKSGEAIVSREFRNDPRVIEENRSRIPEGVGGACIPLHAADRIVGVLFVNAVLPREFTASELRLLNTLAEIGGNAIHRTRLFEQTRQQLEWLEALRAIDLAISSSLDLRISLNIVLEQVTKQLGVDAASVLLMRPETGTLDFAMGRGFRTRGVEATRLRLGQEFPGRAALERQIIRIDHLNDPSTQFQRRQVLADEDFVTYFGVPLIAKGEIKGVLEIFHRSAIKTDMEWLNFLDSLGWQTAIAIDNAMLFEGMQRSNNDLEVAYEATIEGWSKALDLRDKETEGHTQRVTEMTLILARAIGMKEEQLIHMRRGALLHDIGKMGVPDPILLKPGPLTDAEWKTMKLHPQFAYEMLLPIAHLGNALDIPYCHHEKWDGTGYPRGLKGQEIPLAARIFAVVDVWDAVTSDRPYRKKWSREEALKFIQEQSGRHFDPHVVEVFLRKIIG